MVISALKKSKAKKRIRKCQSRVKCTLLNRVAKEVVTQKVEFTQTAKIGKKTSIYMSM